MTPYYIPQFFTKRWIHLVLLGVFGFFMAKPLAAQEKPKLLVKTDTSLIRIGERILLEVSVEADSTRQVTFPEEAKNFGSLEIVEHMPVDTFRVQDRYRLIKKYGLTQFDSGHYTIPSFPIIVSSQTYMTDSLQVQVLDVPVDTLKQKMYDIKDILSVTIPSAFWRFFKWTLFVLILLASLGYYFWYLRKKKKEAEEELPPYEKAVKELEMLDQISLNEQADYKQYYSKLTDVLKNYYESEVQVDVMECTSDELLEKINLLVDSGKLKLDKSHLTQLRNTLKTADLVKFAKYQNDSYGASTDREAIKTFISSTHEAIPEPTEEEILAQERYKALLTQKRKKQRVTAAMVALSLVLVGTAITMVARYGFRQALDTVLRNPGKVMLDGDWVYSEYGVPMVGIETPRVLKQVKVAIPPGSEQVISSMSNYAYGQLGENFYVVVNHINFNPQIDITNDQVKELTEEELKQRLNLEDFQLESQDITIDGINGVRKTGTFLQGSKQYHYDAFTFFVKPSMRQIVIVYDTDMRYYDEISKRIVESLILNKETKP
ncbi:MAG: hypothetical protein RQ735_00040 [Flavobacteriaceae bacterium]|nr:hypothetical protein [Flavobacteriaceae bacterium]